MTTHSTATIWLLIGVTAAGTWLIRISFIALLGRVSVFPDLAMRVLRMIPAAVLAALIGPSLTQAEGAFDLGTERFLAGLLAGLVAWRTRNVLATIGVGMGGLWLLQAVG
ncbi:MAG: AzlD domain-containing protein [Acidimicrobiia bacterium]